MDENAKGGLGPQPNKAIVKALEDALANAKSGSLQGLGLIAVTAGNVGVITEGAHVQMIYLGAGYMQRLVEAQTFAPKTSSIMRAPSGALS